MFIFTPQISSAREKYEDTLWSSAECYRFYAAERRGNCSYLERMNLWLRVPYCPECVLSYPFYGYEPPDIVRSNWEDDVAWKLGGETLDWVKRELIADPDFAFHCKRCKKDLSPWAGDDIHIVSYHLEEHYGIPLETPGRKHPSGRLRDRVFQLYGNVCFACGKDGPGLHLDHILPQSLGGDAAFRNLQPLCEICGQKKGNSLPDEVDVFSDMYFKREPSDGYEGLFW